VCGQRKKQHAAERRCAAEERKNVQLTNICVGLNARP
jgi:hypothetical protein